MRTNLLALTLSLPLLIATLPVLAQPESALCKNVKQVGVNLAKQEQVAENRLGTDACQGSARFLCTQRIRTLQDEIRANAAEARSVCDPNYKPAPDPCPVKAIPNTAPSILNLESLLGGPGYRNPQYDTSSHVWAELVCGSNTWLSGSQPRYEWTPILNKTNELEDLDVATSGTAINAHTSEEDVWFTHPFGVDKNFDVAPDRGYENLSSPIIKPDPDPQGRDNSICRARTQYGLNVSNVLHVEMDSDFVPPSYEAKDGDRVVILGRWIVDCGHDDYGAEIHPPLLFLAARPAGADATHASIISRPFLVSQEFGDGALYDHFIKQLLLVYPPLLPFPLTAMVEARSQIIQKPFSGLRLLNVVIRPPSPRLSPWDKLTVSYQLRARSGVAAELYRTNDDAVGLALVMNDSAYNLATLPKKHNWNVSKAEIRKVRPDVANLIFDIQGAGSSLAQPFGAGVLEKGVDTDRYEMPNIIEVAPVEITASQLPISIQADDTEVWPIHGFIDVRWQRDSSPHEAIEVPANVQWVDTGITLKQGQRFHIEASGQWSNAGPPALGPDGFNGYLYPGTLLGTASLGSLIGKVGGNMFEVGANFDGKSPALGELYLSINDTPSTFSDNQGKLIVKITVE